uniref:Proteasome maturation protein n=1 Tax=Grammatophora oceanica TaxID=210454 RepID=A0A7S1VGR3_9STRA|mmetsp:Transcript_46061/g.68611  ORF Transcript_46061/g.68611 Transcript_46061/m.68611 type:complete len:135 (+) Transcript_46061:112-516(+)|eukprot:CAMPEP_0194028602 /NCGR_PEP_ID=MMETSP0009_2-20130614/2537_1 /TAXON_ID=210454 /ORGANISM="Grammatophora oceanica, Strain CCMP 410" /LENGTH=134 /DNA_ID=CAMNT_0038668047 /DNA_START=112 /DNA_END=516 /DNA_ORIENTATION=-
MTSSTIPVMSKPANTMQGGPNSNNLATQAQQGHPIQAMQEETNPFHDLEHVRRMYGSGLAMRLATERRMASEGASSARLPGMSTPSSNIMFETLTGTDTQIGFEDYLSLPQNAPQINSFYANNPHAVMEHKLNL